MKIAAEVYKKGYHLTGEKNRIDLIAPNNQKLYEFHFFKDEVLILKQDGFLWVKSIENNVLQIKKGIPLFEILESDNDEFIILDETESIFCEDVCGIALYGKQIHVYYKMDRAGRMMKKEYKF